MNFKGAHFPKEVIMMAIGWYIAYPLSYRHVEEMLEERGIKVDHATINRWVIKYAPMLEVAFHPSKRTVDKSWRVDETYIKVKGQWFYYYRAVDKNNSTIDFLLSPKRDMTAARAFLEKSIARHERPEKVNIDKSGSNLAALQEINDSLKEEDKITIRQTKYLNNLIEQDHRFIKKITKPMFGFKSFISAAATLAGIELHHMLRKGQNTLEGQLKPWQQYALAA